VLTQRGLNRALLGRQGLLQRADVGLPQALERIGGLQAQYAPAMYVGLWSRVEQMQRDDLTRALERRVVVQGTLLRSTIHLVSARDYWPFAMAVRQPRRDWFLRVTRGGVIAPALDRLTLRRVRAEDGAELVDLPGAPLPDPDTPAPVRFLPTWDATLLVHARRSQVLPERHRAKVFSTKTPHSVGTFLVDGAVAGTWRYDAGVVHIDEFDALPRSVRADVDAEAERLAAFHA
jgi:hypothetical protein